MFVSENFSLFPFTTFYVALIRTMSIAVGSYLRDQYFSTFLVYELWLSDFSAMAREIAG